MIPSGPKEIKGRDVCPHIEKRVAANITKYEWCLHLSAAIMGCSIFSFLCVFSKLYAENMYQFYVLERNKCFCFILQIPWNGILVRAYKSFALNHLRQPKQVQFISTLWLGKAGCRLRLCPAQNRQVLRGSPGLALHWCTQVQTGGKQRRLQNPWREELLWPCLPCTLACALPRQGSRCLTRGIHSSRCPSGSLPGSRAQLVSSHVAIAPEVARCCSRASSELLRMKAASSRFWAHPPLLLLLALLSQSSKAYIPGIHPPAMLGLWAVAPGEDGPAWLESRARESDAGPSLSLIHI